MRRIFLALLLGLAFCAPLSAQRGVPRRPALPAAADTNDASAYLQYGAARLRTSARDAADAFYWAMQLNPASAEALYGRYTALLLTDPARLLRYWEGDRRTARSREVMAIDSLLFRAMTLDPFLYRKYEHELFRTAYRTAIRRDVDQVEGGMSVSENDIQSYLDALVARGGPWLKAQEAYSRSRFAEALTFYDQAMRETRRKAWLRAERSRIMEHMGQRPQAIAEMRQAIDEMRRTDERDLIFIYESKAILEHSVATLHERLGNLDSAQVAYGRALEEDLSFYPAHMRLAMIALSRADTTTALAELDLAAQVANEPYVGYTYGTVLAQAGKLDEAAAQLEKVIAAAPHYAAPHAMLGLVRDWQGNTAAAVAAYRGFLARAPANDPRRAQLQARVTDLAGGGQ